jgi:hypothetical protein
MLHVVLEALMSRKSAEKNYLKPKAGKSVNNFGRIVAEQDPELQDYYVDPERYVARAMDFNDPAVFFVGPKGAGKSAILQMVRLNRATDEGRVISISPDDLAFSALANVNAGTPILRDISKNQWLFKSLWDYVLSLEVLRREYKDRSAFTSTLQKIVRFFLEISMRKRHSDCLKSASGTKESSGHFPSGYCNS